MASSTDLTLTGNLPSLRMTEAKSGALALAVLSGVHSGVRTPIEGSVCTIGSSPDCDLVLADCDVVPEHLHLRSYGKVLAIDAVGGDVAIEGYPDLARGFGRRVTLPVTLRVGEARLRLERNDSGNPGGRHWLLYAALFLFVVLVPVVSFRAAVSALLPQAAASYSEVRPDDPRPHPAAPAQSPLDTEIVGTLRERIASAGLDGLSVVPDGRSLSVSGVVRADQTAAWEAIQQWFDRTFGGRYVLTSLVANAAATKAPAFTFQAVWFGKNPYVIDGRGDRRYPGAALQDGWTLKAIERGQIVVARDGEEFRLTL